MVRNCVAAIISSFIHLSTIKAIGGGRRSKKNLLCKTMLKGPNFKGVIPKVDKNYF